MTIGNPMGIILDGPSLSLSKLAYFWQLNMDIITPTFLFVPITKVSFMPSKKENLGALNRISYSNEVQIFYPSTHFIFHLYMSYQQTTYPIDHHADS